MKRQTHEATVRIKTKDASLRRPSFVTVIAGISPVIDYGPPPDITWAFRWNESQNTTYYLLFFR